MLLSSEELLKSAVSINTVGLEPKGIQLKKNTSCYFISHLCQGFDMTRTIRNRNLGDVATGNIFRCRSYYGIFNTSRKQNLHIKIILHDCLLVLLALSL